MDRAADRATVERLAKTLDCSTEAIRQALGNLQRRKLIRLIEVPDTTEKVT